MSAPAPAPDRGRAAVYAAEQQIWRLVDRAGDLGVAVLDWHGSSVVVPIERRFGEPSDVRRYLDQVLALAWVRAEFSRADAPIRVRARRGAAAAHYERSSATVAVPPWSAGRGWALREFVVLHELAHHLEPDPAAASHGPGFRERYRTLVGGVVGPEAEWLLRVALHEAGVA